MQEDSLKPDYIGAPAPTNNTGEMSAMYYALQRTLQRPRASGREEIHSDSLYAIHMATGKWMPQRKHRNAPMIADLRRMWRRVQVSRPREVTLHHVRSHTKVPGNELADWLADNGAQSRHTTSLACASAWMRAWLDEHDDRLADRGTGVGDPRGEG